MKQVAKTTKNSKANKRKTEREEWMRGQVREALIEGSLFVLNDDGSPMMIDEIARKLPFEKRTSARTLSAALRVARRNGRVLFDGKRYSLPASEPAAAPGDVPRMYRGATSSAPTTNAEPPPFSADGPLTRGNEAKLITVGDEIIGVDMRDMLDDDAPVTPTLPSPRPQTIVPPAPLPAWVRDGQRVRGIGAMSGCKGVLHPKQVGGWFIQDGKAVLDIYDAAGIEKEWAPVYDAQPAPGFARDLAERQAFRPSTARERIASVLRGAGLTEATEAQPGVIVRVGRDGRIGLRWGVKRADGATSSAAVTEHAERLMERAANALHDAGYKAVEWQCASEELAPRPSEAAERIAALEAELATAKQRLAAVTTALTSTTLALSLAVGGAP